MLDRPRDLTESGATNFTVETLDKSLTREQTCTVDEIKTTLCNYANFVVRIKQIFIPAAIGVPNEFLPWNEANLFFFSFSSIRKKSRFSIHNLTLLRINLNRAINDNFLKAKKKGKKLDEFLFANFPLN